MVVHGTGYPGCYQQNNAGYPDSGSCRFNARFLDGRRRCSFNDVLWYQGYRSKRIPVYRLSALLNRIISYRFIMVNSWFHGCCTYRCRYCSWIPGLHDSWCCSIRRIFRRQDVTAFRYYQPCSCSSRCYTVRSYQAHDLDYRPVTVYRISCLSGSRIH